jgi:DNA-directed RNA polymerase subunit RPC12/RpoP
MDKQHFKPQVLKSMLGIMKSYRCGKCGSIVEVVVSRPSLDPKTIKCACGGRMSLMPVEEEEHEMTAMAYELGRDE